MPDEVRFILNRLYANGYDGYMVGGCVRDLLMSKKPSDYDLCTDAPPNEVKRIFSGFPVIETGLRHGTLTLLMTHGKYEITTFRTEGGYSDNRRPDDVHFVTDIREDLRRRDFTVNAMAYSERDGLIDPFGGIEDIKNRLIRAVGEPSERFREDGLRIMRALRFASTLNFEIEKNTSNSLIINAHLLQNISPERLNGELSRLILGDGAVKILLKYREVIAQFMPELVHMFDFCQHNRYHIYDVYEHSVRALGYAPRDEVVRLAMLLHDIGKPSCFEKDEQGVGHFYGHEKGSAAIADIILRRLRYKNATIENVCELILHHQSPPTVGKKSVKRSLLKLGEEQFYRLLEVKAADVSAQSEFCIAERLAMIEDLRAVATQIIKSESCPTLAELAINGDDLISLGYAEGREIGSILSALHEQVINENLPNERGALLIFLSKYGSIDQ